MSEYTETDLILNLAHHMKMCRETARALGHMRKDARWLDVSKHFFTLGEKLEKLVKSGTRRLIV
jgi:hypothetical protein